MTVPAPVERGFAQTNHMTDPCYGMSGANSSALALPQVNSARKGAARVRRIKGVTPMSKFWFCAVAGSALMSLSAVASAEAKVPLPEEQHINEQLIAAAEGDLIRNNCPAISARMFVVFDKMLALKSYAEGKGYTEAEVKLFLKDKVQKARVKAAAVAYLASAGAVEGDGASYCAVGRAEIAKGTLLGSLLKE